MKHIEIINGPNLTQLRQICNLAQKIIRIFQSGLQ